MAAVTLHPMPFDAVRRDGFEQLLPQLGVLDRLLIRRAPAVALPVVDPAGDSVANILAVCVEMDSARPFQRLEALYGGEQLHPVVGRQRLATRYLALLVGHPQQRGPAAGAGIAAASAVREDLDQVAQATSSRGSLKVMRSALWSAISSLTLKRVRSVSSTSRTSTSGAEAPAVIPSVEGWPSHDQSMSSARSMSRDGTPIRSATSANRNELLLLGAPITSMRSHSGATAFTAACRLEVA